RVANERPNDDIAICLLSVLKLQFGNLFLLAFDLRSYVWLLWGRCLLEQLLKVCDLRLKTRDAAFDLLPCLVINEIIHEVCISGSNGRPKARMHNYRLDAACADRGETVGRQALFGSIRLVVLGIDEESIRPAVRACCAREPLPAAPFGKGIRVDHHEMRIEGTTPVEGQALLDERTFATQPGLCPCLVVIRKKEGSRRATPTVAKKYLGAMPMLG